MVYHQYKDSTQKIEESKKLLRDAEKKYFEERINNRIQRQIYLLDICKKIDVNVDVCDTIAL